MYFSLYFLNPISIFLFTIIAVIAGIHINKAVSQAGPPKQIIASTIIDITTTTAINNESLFLRISDSIVFKEQI